MNTRVTVAKGDGIGPGIMDDTQSIIQATGTRIEIDEIEAGEQVYLAGNKGIDIIKTENLYAVEGPSAYSVAQGSKLHNKQYVIMSNATQQTAAIHPPATHRHLAQLIDGNFEPEQARKLLVELLNFKIRHHQLTQFSNEERFGNDPDHSAHRIQELTGEKQALKDWLSALEASDVIRISGRIELELVR